MGFTHLAIAVLFFACSLASAARVRRVRGWVFAKASVVHCYRTTPFGRDPRKMVRTPREILVLLEDGTEETVTIGHHPDPQVMYFAEVVYFVDGAPHEGLLACEAAVDDTLDIRVNPADPYEYEAADPDYSLARLLGVVGSLFLLVALI